MGLFNSKSTTALAIKIAALEQAATRAAVSNAAAISAITLRVSELEQASIRRAMWSAANPTPRNVPEPAATPKNVPTPRVRPAKRLPLRGTPADNTNTFWGKGNGGGVSYPVYDVERMAAAIGRSVEYIMTARVVWSHGTVEAKVRKSCQRGARRAIWGQQKNAAA
jgi:hypothetical protein